MRWNAKAFELWEVFIYQIMLILIRPSDEGKCRGRPPPHGSGRKKKEGVRGPGSRTEGGIDLVVENVEKEITMREEDGRICC